MHQYIDSGSAQSGRQRQGAAGCCRRQGATGISRFICKCAASSGRVKCTHAEHSGHVFSKCITGYMPNPNWQFFAPNLPPRVEGSDRGNAEIRSAAPSNRSSQTRISQEPTPLSSKHARFQTASYRSLSPKRTTHKGSILSTLPSL